MKALLLLCVIECVAFGACASGLEVPSVAMNLEATHRVNLITTAHGTAVVLDRSGYLLTCYHVVKRGESKPFLRFSVDGATFLDLPATIIAWDQESDLAVIKVERTFVSVVTLGQPEDVHVLDALYIVGFPYDLGKMAGYGHVKNASWFDQRRGISGELAIEFTDGRGMSGAGVYLVRNGHLVGILRALASATGAEGQVKDNEQAQIRIAVPIRKIREFLDRAGIPYHSAAFLI